MSECEESSSLEHAELDAYRRAWKSREETGDNFFSVLLEEWARIDYAPDEEEREIWLEAWASSVPPRRLGRFLVKRTGREVVSAVREIREILNDPVLPDWLLPPPEFRMLSVGFLREDIKKRTVHFTPDPEPSAVLDRMLRLREKKDGYRTIRVWLNPGKNQSRVAVMAGVSRIGWTSLDKTQMRRLRPKPWARRTSVADGNLKFILGQTGELTAGKLKVHLPPSH